MPNLPSFLSEGEIVAAVEADENTGFCISCGEQTGGVEPDAQNYECDSCGEHNVFGAAQLLLMFCW